MKNKIFVSLMLKVLLTTHVFANQNHIQIIDVKTGHEREISRHDTVTLHYKGWLSNGVLFDDSYQRKAPITLTRGTGSMLPSWEIALNGMRIGGIKEFSTPPQLAFGRKGVAGVIPSNETLRFLIEVTNAEEAPFKSIDKNELEELVKNESVLLVDVRREDEWQSTGVINGSLLLTAFDKHDRFNKQFRQDLEPFITPGSKLILICRTGNRTGLIARALVEQAGFKNVLNLNDGIVDWKESGGAVRRDCPKLNYGSICID